MAGIFKKGSLFLLFFLVALISGTGCASDKKAREILTKAGESSCDLAHLGKNKYFYSNHYKKRMAFNIRYIERKYK